MAAFLSRTPMATPAANGRPSVGLPGDVVRKVRDNSPLQIFVNAKRKINDIYVEIEDYVKDSVSYMRSLQNNDQLFSNDDFKVVESHISKVRSIRDVLLRDHMKVAFFGRTSNGKSTVINAMLKDKILPSGIGHTTNCFLQVEGSESGEAYLVTEDSSEKQNVKSVGQLGHALCKEKLKESQMVRIFWPKEKCLLLRDDVVLVDSPGIDVTPNLDEWIDKHCLDADVFVLVANAESTLMVTEKNFFHKVSQRLSKPNIFILNNRWDAAASEVDYMDQVRAQHTERTVDFLVTELGVCTTEEAAQRIFFVSAKEALQARLQEQKGQPAHTGALAEGFPKRYFEFQDFEKKFEECISQSAVKTKFEQHSQQGQHVVSEVKRVMDAIYEKSLKTRSEKLMSKKEVHDKLNFTEQQLMLLTQEMKDKIHQMVEDVEQRVSKALSEEIHRLSTLVDEFNLPFHPEPLVLNVYKKEMHLHVENGLGSNLRARLSTALALNIENSQREMTDRMAILLPDDKKQVSLTILPRREPFEILYRLNCDNLCADFHENLEFRFSWGITSLISRFMRARSSDIAVLNRVERIPQPLTPLGDPGHTVSLRGDSSSEDWNFLSKIAVASISSQGTFGGLFVAGFMLKTVGWRLILVSGAIYGCLYMYERLTWTNKAKERSFKKQYVNHATNKLKLIVDLTSANCSHQVQQELSSTFARLCHLVDESIEDMSGKVKTLEKEVKLLEESANSAKVLRNKANYVARELKLFDEAYLKQQD
ncbi:transmembrane GTPase Marf [Neocloeon triangulifer]|uniref:transmembrane GTPase Marf n=1 Tax=Neocloeon triangulifer TaxID=2078957 RepID=UPI00286F030F|nr:transmembrane GTPase Marf [Neocloeon triangulifer]